MVERYSYRRESEISHFTTSHSNHPSFSSTLLDAIYRSIDEGEDEMVIYKERMRKKQSFCSDIYKSDEEMANFRRACMIEKWMEKKANENAAVRRKSAADLQVKKPRKDRENSSWSSSDSSCGGGGGGGGAGFFSSSETESFPVQRPKPIRTEKLGGDSRDFGFNRRESEQKAAAKSEGGGFSKTKLRALKIYGDLKKVKQPISPGGKLARFLNSLFAGGGKNKISDGDSPSLKSSTTCSSASSFSRSCLSKTPSSRGKSAAAAAAGVKRSVRFSPVSVIVNEDCQPCGHKSLDTEIIYNSNNIKKKQASSNFEAIKNYNNDVNSIRNAINEELMAHVMEKNRRVEEVARDLLRNYQRKSNIQIGYEHELSFDHLRKSHVKNQIFDQDFDDEEDDDDAASYASSDLFELDNLSAIGMERYREELPVYETTHLDSSVTNKLIF